MRESRKEYLRKYQREWRRKRRQEWINSKGNCIKCGSNKQLEIDHIDPKQKVYPVSSLWGMCQEKRDLELSKCQVLCHECHSRKTIEYRKITDFYSRFRINSKDGLIWCSTGHFTDKLSFGTNKAKTRGINSECNLCRRMKRTLKLTKDQILSQIAQ